MNLRLSAATAISILLLSLPAAAGEARFFSALEDVPLAPGLTELRDESLSFDKPEGRILESLARVDGGAEDSILAFYDSALPQLGWARRGPGTFAREGETLTLSFEESGARKAMRATIAPSTEK